MIYYVSLTCTTSSGPDAIVQGRARGLANAMCMHSHGAPPRLHTHAQLYSRMRPPTQGDCGGNASARTLYQHDSVLYLRDIRHYLLVF